jgi:hypothetical protein
MMIGRLLRNHGRLLLHLLLLLLVLLLVLV